MPAFSAASGSFHVKSSTTNFVMVFLTVRLLPFFLTVVSICSCTLMVSTFRVRSYTDQRYWSMHSSLRTHSSEASSGLTFATGLAGGSFMAGSATAAAQSRTAKLPHTKQPNALKILKAPRSYHPAFRLNRWGEWLPTICRLAMRLVQMRLGEDREERRLTKWSWSTAMPNSRFICPFFTVRLQRRPYRTTADLLLTAVHTRVPSVAAIMTRAERALHASGSGADQV